MEFTINFNVLFVVFWYTGYCFCPISAKDIAYTSAITNERTDSNGNINLHEKANCVEEGKDCDGPVDTCCPELICKNGGALDDWTCEKCLQSSNECRVSNDFCCRGLYCNPKPGIQGYGNCKECIPNLGLCKYRGPVGQCCENGLCTEVADLTLEDYLKLPDTIPKDASVCAPSKIRK